MELEFMNHCPVISSSRIDSSAPERMDSLELADIAVTDASDLVLDVPIDIKVDRRPPRKQPDCPGYVDPVYQLNVI